MAPPNRRENPLAVPVIKPPNKEQRRRSVPASGEAILTLIGRTSSISHAKIE